MPDTEMLHTLTPTRRSLVVPARSVDTPRCTLVTALMQTAIVADCTRAAGFSISCNTSLVAQSPEL